MGAPLEFCSKRGVVAVLASGIVISLTALTGGIAPALAKPGSDDPSGPTTTVMAPAPKAKEPKQEEAPKAPKAPKEDAPKQQAPEPKGPAPAVEAPAPPSQPAPQTQAPQTQAPKTQAPQTQAPQTQAPKTQAPETQAPAAVEQPEPEPQTQAPKTTVGTTVQPTEPAVTAEPEPSATNESKPSSTAERSPAGSAAPSTESKVARTTQADADAPPTSGTSVAPSEALAPDTEASKAPSSPSSESPTSESKTTTRDGESETPTVSISQAAKQIKTLEPETLEAPAEDVKLAKSAEPILEKQPEPAAEKDVAAFANSIQTSLKIPGLDIGASAKTEFGVERRAERRQAEFVSNVRQWRPEWIEYDRYYRPIIANPFRAPVRIVYVYDMRPRIMYIPPLSRIVLEAARFAAYSFTAAILNPINAAIDTAQALTNIAVGSFFGGGYYPGAGLPLPPPPPRVLRYDNVPVQVRYSDATYQPFRVRRIVDVGEDARFGERKVLLDGATPAWGVWTQTPSGERQFEVHRTQQFPGLEEPQEGPLPGDYRLQLASDESSSAGLTGRDIFLMVAAGVIGTLGFGAIGLAFFLGRRRPEH